MKYEIDAARVEDRFAYFAAQYPNRTKRFVATRALLNPANEISVNYPSRLALAVHWADTKGQLYDLASYFYGIGQTAADYSKQHAIVLTQGTPEAVMEEKSMLMSPLGFYIGKIGTHGVTYNFITKTHATNQASPRIIAKASIEVGRVQKVTTDIGMATVEGSSPDVTSMPFYAAAISATSDLTTYARSREAVRQFPVILGNYDCASFLGQLANLNPTDELEQLAHDVALEAA